MNHPHVRFSQRKSTGLGSMHYLLHSHTIRIPRSRELAKWKYAADWATDSFSHEYIHSWLYKHISSRDLPEGLKVSNPGLYASKSLDRLRETHWEHSPDRAGLHLKAEYLEQLDYENLYELLADT